MRDKILSEIRTVVNAHAKSAGFGMVADSAAESGNGTSILIYNNGENGLTTAVLDQLNAGAPMDVSKPSEKKKDEPKTDEKK